MPFMALTPGGGRSPSTKPPPSPLRPGQQRPVRDSRQSPTPRVASLSVVRWGLLIGGLVIIADLATQATLQRTTSPDDVTSLVAADHIINVVLFLTLGVLVVRETGVFYLGAIAGVFASVLDSIVVAAAGVMAPPPGAQVNIEDVFIDNLTLGVLFAGLSGGVYLLIQRWSSGRRR